VRALAELVISPPSLYLAQVQEQVRKEIAVSAQNCYHQDGAFTGEITYATPPTRCCS
jgi:triosephosphate isomerase